MIRLTPFILLLGAVGAGAAIEARADVDTTYITPSGFYAGVGWGHFNLDLDSLDDVGTAVTDIVHSSDNAWKVNLGYRFSPYFALEADYMDFGRPSDNFTATGANGNYRLHLDGFAPFAVATLPLGPAEIFAKAGYLFYNSRLTVNFNSPGSEVFESTHTRSNFMYGGGVGVTVARHLNLNAEYDVVRVQNARNSNVLWLSPVWRF
ncbi:MAG: porin family protein [Gammaproteobacteria bacterium]|nr:porin family protein [Gammaproteobacteria bacterium]